MRRFPRVIYGSPFSFFLCKVKGKPSLRVLIHQDACEILFDPDEIGADSVAAINISQQSLEFIVGNRSLILFQSLPLRRIGEGIAQEINGKGGRDREAEKEENGEGEQGPRRGEDPKVKMMKDHGLDFRLINTMVGEC